MTIQSLGKLPIVVSEKTKYTTHRCGHNLFLWGYRHKDIHESHGCTCSSRPWNKFSIRNI